MVTIAHKTRDETTTEVASNNNLLLGTDKANLWVAMRLLNLITTSTRRLLLVTVSQYRNRTCMNNP